MAISNRDERSQAEAAGQPADPFAAALHGVRPWSEARAYSLSLAQHLLPDSYQEIQTRNEFAVARHRSLAADPVDRLRHALGEAAGLTDRGSEALRSSVKMHFRECFHDAVEVAPASALNLTIKFASYALRDRAHPEIAPMLAHAAAGRLDAHAQKNPAETADFARRLLKLPEAVLGADIRAGLAAKRGALLVQVQAQAAKPAVQPRDRLDFLPPIVRPSTQGLGLRRS